MSGEQQGGLDFSAVLAKLTENPALLSGILSSLSPSSTAGETSPESLPTSDSAPQPTKNLDPEMISKMLPVLSSLGGSLPSSPSPVKGSNPRCELLRALRPFLSPERCEAIDYMIKMDGLSGILQNFKK